MTPANLILFLLAIWWLALAIVVAGDKSRKKKLSTQEAKLKPDPSLGHQPRWPSWSEYRSRPSLFFIIPWCALVYALFLIFIWPAILIHKI
jgi:hypothetical protein